MQFLVNANYDFMGKRKLALAISAIATVISIASLIAHGGPRYSVDFTGGSFVEVRFDRPVETGALRAAVNAIGLGATEIQKVGAENDYIFRMSEAEVTARTKELLQGEVANPFGLIQHAVQKQMPDVEMTLRRQETVGPKIGRELRDKATKAVLIALVLMLVYIGFRFPGVSFAVCAVVALFHDVILTIGVNSLLDKEFSLNVLAALMTIAGYSINDTIVVYDRIREEMKAHRREPLPQLINRAVNLTLSRTMLTGLTTVLSLIALLLFGGAVIHDFAFTLLVGIVWGTYSSVFVAAALIVVWHNWETAREAKRGGRRGERSAAARPA
jgi:preprotein translocase SecF subunit